MYPSNPSHDRPTLTAKQHKMLVLVLGALSAVGPFSVDMYLPGFPAIATDFQTDTAQVTLSLTSYFIGISLGQLVYGPIMDRYGRRKPLLLGLLIYIVAAAGCALAPSVQILVGLRFFLALGACVGMAGSRAVVRDLFSGSEIARMLSMLMMVFGVAPIIAPTIGGLVVAALGWRYIFVVLASIAVLVFVAVRRFLPESKGPDPSVSLRPKNVVLEYAAVFKNRDFLVYTFSSAAAFGGFFSYISDSPFVYMKLLGFSETQFGWIYGANALGFIGASQFNRLLLRRYGSGKLLNGAVAAKLGLALLLLIGAIMGLLGRVGIITLVFCYLFCLGFVGPNAMALTLQPFTRNAGIAAALMGSLQMTAGASASALVSYLHNGTAVPMASMMFGCTAVSLAILILGEMHKRSER